MPRPAEPLPMRGDQVRELERLISAHCLSARQAIRAQALMLAAEGLSHEEISRRCQAGPKTVARWRRSFLALGVESVLRTSGRETPSPPPELIAMEHLLLGGCYSGALDRVAVAWPDADQTGAGRLVVDTRANSVHDFLRFLKEAELCSPPAEPVHVLIERGASHALHQVDRWLTHPRRERFRLYRAPDPGSWARLVSAWWRRSPVSGVGDPLDSDGPGGQWVLRSTDRGTSHAIA